jgi:hypothetical protein
MAWWPTRQPSIVRLRGWGLDRTWGNGLGIPGVSLASIRGVVRGHISEAGAWIEASVWFRSSAPSNQALAIANAELDHLHIIHC